MAEKIMVDSTVHWARHYRVDGFRFDLMGHHSKANMLRVRAALDKLTLAKDGVDGKQVYVYGEGWNFGEVTDDARFVQARQGNLGGTGIGTFSDRLRDAVRGGGPFDENPRIQGFGSGAASDPNGDPINGDVGRAGETAGARHRPGPARPGREPARVQLHLGRDRSGRPRGPGRLQRTPAGYADQPDEIITYVDAHDNETLFDVLTYKLPPAMPMASGCG